MGQVITLLLKLICFHFIDEDTEGIFLMPFSQGCRDLIQIQNHALSTTLLLLRNVKTSWVIHQGDGFQSTPNTPSSWVSLKLPWSYLRGCPDPLFFGVYIYPLYPIYRYACKHLCMCVYIIQIYIIYGNSKSCAPILPCSPQKKEWY